MYFNTKTTIVIPEPTNFTEAYHARGWPFAVENFAASMPLGLSHLLLKMQPYQLQMVIEAKEKAGIDDQILKAAKSQLAILTRSD